MFAIQAMKASVDAVLGAGSFDSMLINTKRSSLPTPVYSITEDYTAMAYHTDMDVWALDIGTTSTFAASHPITSGIGADSSVLLTELGVIKIDGMDNRNKGFVARSGFNEGSW